MHLEELLIIDATGNELIIGNLTVFRTCNPLKHFLDSRVFEFEIRLGEDRLNLIKINGFNVCSFQKHQNGTESDILGVQEVRAWWHQAHRRRGDRLGLGNEQGVVG